MFNKASVEELHAAMVTALAEQQNEELALCKAQLAVEQEKNAQLERRIASLKAQLKESEVAAKFLQAFQLIIQPLIPEPVYVPVVERGAEAAQP